MAAAAREHPRQDEPREDQRADEVELDDRVKLVLAEVVELALRVPAGVVDQHVDASEAALDDLDDLTPVLGRGHVARHGERSRAPSLEIARDRGEALLAAGDERDLRPALRERGGDVRADAARGARDDGGGSLQLETMHG